MHRYNNKVILLKYLFIGLFICVCLYLIYFNLFLSRNIASNSYNKRLRNTDTNVIRGSILDRNNKELAKSYKYKNSIKRKYIYDRYFAHIIGYYTKNLGSSGLEALFNNELMSSDNPISKIKSKVSGETIKGNNIKLTLDSSLQEYASNLLRGKKGSIVVLNPKTGEILAMVSKPDYNPSNVQENWDSLIEDKNSPLLNRATEGLYPPGSIFKIIVAADSIKNKQQDFKLECSGKVNIDGYEIKDYESKPHGNINLTEAFKVSCNSYFVKMGFSLGKDNLFSEAVKFKFNKEISSPTIKIAQSVFPRPKDDKSNAQQSIGQGSVLITPIHAALIAASVANEGIMMEPYVVSSIINSEGKTIKTFKPKQIAQIMDKNTSEIINEMMQEVVKSGTGMKAKWSREDVAGKTGTAENSQGKPHAWFIGFAPADNPKIALAVLIENGGSGGANAAPIALKVIKKAISLIE